MARDLYLTEAPLRQKVPLTVEQVRQLEPSMQTIGGVFRCTLGQSPFCVHVCFRWKDVQHLKSITTESGHGETQLYADAPTLKTAVTMEAEQGFWPHAAIGSGFAMMDWVLLWLEARNVGDLTCTGCMLPIHSEEQTFWLETPLRASGATAWLRDFSEGTAGFRPERVGSHLFKATLLTWAGRCVRASLSPAERCPREITWQAVVSTLDPFKTERAELKLRVR